MMQKDPRFRYQSATAVADILERWRTAYRVAALQARRGGGGTGSGIGDTTGRTTKPKPDDTINQRSAETRTDNSRVGRRAELSSSNSGILVSSGNKSTSVRPSESSSSMIDLQLESKGRSNSQSKERSESSIKDKTVLGEPKSASTIKGTVPPKEALNSNAGPPSTAKSLTMWQKVMIVLLGLVIAATSGAAGFYLAKLTQ
jgi:serine/threonine-protein kinase